MEIWEILSDVFFEYMAARSKAKVVVLPVCNAILFLLEHLG